MDGQLSGGPDSRPVPGNALGAFQAGLGTSSQQRNIAPTRSCNLRYIAHSPSGTALLKRLCNREGQTRIFCQAGCGELGLTPSAAPAKRSQDNLGAVAFPESVA